MHVSARTIATHALSIFGDHSDVMACRSDRLRAARAPASVQEAHDFAGHRAGGYPSRRARAVHSHLRRLPAPRTRSSKIQELEDDDLRFMLPDALIAAHRARALSPDRPVIRGTAQNPDAFFQAREACNPFYDACPSIVQDVMNLFAGRMGRQYGLFDYVGAIPRRSVSS
jgi:pyruvate-ferredoxin/flavodoxin oxidoreductase